MYTIVNNKLETNLIHFLPMRVSELHQLLIKLMTYWGRVMAIYRSN